MDTADYKELSAEQREELLGALTPGLRLDSVIVFASLCDVELTAHLG
jgi:hypothetical protein